MGLDRLLGVVSIGLVINYRNMAEALGISRGSVGNYVKRGMPMHTVEAARAWMGGKRETVIEPTLEPDNGSSPLGDTDGLGRLRKIETATAEALCRALKDGRIPEAAALRREHITALKALYESEAKALKYELARGKVVSMARVHSMIGRSFRAGVIALKRLPEIGQTPEEKTRLEVFLNGVLAEFKVGAADGFENPVA
jgi:hypothetical protein